MLYTIGHCEGYTEAQARKGKEPLIKVGRDRGYPGGIVFLNEEAAWQYIDNQRLYEYCVFGLDCDMDSVYNTPDSGSGMALNEDVVIIFLQPHQEIK